MIKIPHLETDVTTACQLSCVACNHHVPLWRAAGPKHADPRQVEIDLFTLSNILHADVWGALGGEPTLNPKLVDILKIARESGIADTIEVWTNGLTLPRMSEEFWRSFDVLVLSIYPGKHDEDSLAWIAAKCADTGRVLSLRDERNQPNFFYTCCCAPHMSTLVQGQKENRDGIKIFGLTEDQLNQYLNRTNPLNACFTCAGRDTAVSIPWREERDPEKWLRASAGRSE